MPSDVTRRNFLATAAPAVIAGTSTVIANAVEPTPAGAPSKAVKILGICCSPRKGKTTAAALRICLDAAKAVDNRIEVELIELAGLKIPGEVAAGVELEPGERDDFPALLPNLSSPTVGGRP